MATIGERILEARAVRGIKQTALDAAAGLSQGTVSRYESGERVKPGGQIDVVIRLARELDVRLEWLLTGEGPRDVEASPDGAADPCPARTAAAEIALEGGVIESAVEAVLEEPADASRTRLYWIDRMRERAFQMMRAGIHHEETPPARSHVRGVQRFDPPATGTRTKS